MFTISTLCDDKFDTKVVCAYHLDGDLIRFDEDRCDDGFFDTLRVMGVNIELDDDGNAVVNARYQPLFEAVFSSYPYVLNDEDMIAAASRVDSYRDSLPPPQHVA
ncbi:MAG: hypothetical protein P1P90_00870 [Patescibacteria group bacterium]|nr:hypothetical protein [Patescibacteria group bacterium]